jgi:peptidoglycan/LPS O-acetylase OafA/YrhL
VLAAVSVKQFGDFHLKTESRAMLLMAGIASAAGIAAGFDFDRLSAVCGICIVLLAAVPGTRHAVGEVAGGMSYQLYLNHWIGVFVGHALFAKIGLRDSPERQAFSAVFDIGLAVGLYWFIDRRLHVIRARWATPMRERFAITAGYGLVLMGCAVGGFLAYR